MSEDNIVDLANWTKPYIKHNVTGETQTLHVCPECGNHEFVVTEMITSIVCIACKQMFDFEITPVWRQP